MTKVLITAPFPEALIQKVGAVSNQIEIVQIDISRSGWPADAIADTEVLYATSQLPDPDDVPNLRWIQAHWAGVDHLRSHPIWETEIQITTTSGIHAPNIGQYVMAQILAWSNKVHRWYFYQQQHEWPKDRWGKLLPNDLRGSTIGILGYGSIGREIARLARSFGMTVLATKKDARKLVDDGYVVPGTGDVDGMMAHRIYPMEATRLVLADSDYVVVTLPLTKDTEFFIDEQHLRAMKENCFLVNVGRGKLIKEEELTRALEKGWIAGAGLDVFEEEPLPADSPLWSMNNVIISPHISGFTQHYDDRATDLFAENLRRYVNNEPLLNLVDRNAGY